ncbi:unnamed protein product [Adineta steineri]|uniref:TIR domain-containing protein n=1 Tax=Adineta steineri TaxID=433720 RepID=A0A819V8A7_9BILA|nr:unnamed protein product [Adineta steineri]CAF4105224.1 unnamed protein product [Adineta steineri]
MSNTSSNDLLGEESNEQNPTTITPENRQIGNSTPPNATTNTGSKLPPISETTSPPTNQDEVGRPEAISTKLPWNSNRYIREWTSDEVLGWFQLHGLNELCNCLFAPDEVNGKTLEEMFKLKQKNYERYRVYYTNRLASNPNNLPKDFDRFEQLLDSYFIDKRVHRFDVAFSFAGEIRNRVSQIADKLCVKINRQDGRKPIFYDNYHKAELARPNLDLYLHTIYRYQTRLIVVFMCDEYSRKEWCGLEARAIRSLLKTHQSDRIMLLTVDGKRIEGVLDIDGYMDISQENDDNVVDAIHSRLEALGHPLPLSQPLHTPTQQLILEGVLSKRIEILRNVLRSISPWYIIIVLLSYILGTIIGR